MRMVHRWSYTSRLHFLHVNYMEHKKCCKYSTYKIGFYILEMNII
jgi:hypothetical protein